MLLYFSKILKLVLF